MTAPTPALDLLPRLQRSAAHAFTPFQRQMDRLFEDLGDGWNAFADIRLSPTMDAVETDEGLEITLELPGLTRDDVTITVDEDVLTVSGEKKAGHEAKDHGYRVKERSYGAFSRSIPLPRSVEVARMTATMADGVLRIVAARRPDAEVTTIPIQPA